MGSVRETGEDEFFDTGDVLASLPGSDEDSSECSSEECSTSGFGYDYWAGNMDSVDERRDRFLKFMGLSAEWLAKDREEEQEDDDEFRDESKWIVDRKEEQVDETEEKIEPVMPENTDFQDAFLCRQPSLSCWSNRAMELVQSGSAKEEVTMERRDSDETVEDISMKRSFDFCADRSIEWQGNSGSSSGRSSQKEGENVSLLDRRKKAKKGWLQKLNVMARMNDKEAETASLKSNSTNSKSNVVRVHANKKKSKELSSLYATQEFTAHTGSISTMKFSHDGRYLASAGNDGIVRVWEVSEDEDPRSFNIQGTDPSSIYFSTNHLSELAPMRVDKEKTRKLAGLGKSSELACVIIPPKVFRILEKPIHEFLGHVGEILSLSWSRKGYLLSSSIDNTVRMWQIGHDRCLKVFTHTNYVTCIEFNPTDDNYFISGSIDGKVRIWEVCSCQVIDWIDIREIVTAVCYYPDGKGSIVGTLEGNCIFYDIVDSRLQLGAQASLMSKKKWPRRITGFQFCPTDSRKVIVSSADSKVRILCGVNLVGKFKGNRSSGTQMPASFTADGKHIVSAAEDSNVYVWNHVNSDKPLIKAKNNLSCESFFSRNSSIAIPWCGIKSIAASLPSPRLNNNNDLLPRSTIDSPRRPSPRRPSSSPTRGFFLESLLKGPPTWPAESLPNSTQVSVSPSMRKSEYKFLRNAYHNTFVAPHMWGLVIVAAGWDGRIRTYLNYGLPLRL